MTCSSVSEVLKGFCVRTCLVADFLLCIPVFLLLICVSPDKYAGTLAQSGETIRRKIAKYRK